MRAIAVSLWIFINLVFVGMCGYIYLLWSQYWQYVERQQEHMAELMNTARSSGGGSSQIFYYNHDSNPSTEDPDAIAVAYRNKINALPKHHSYEKSGNKSSVGCKYVMQGMWILQRTTYFFGIVVQCTPKLLKVHTLIFRLWSVRCCIISLADGYICFGQPGSFRVQSHLSWKRRQYASLW